MAGAELTLAACETSLQKNVARKGFGTNPVQAAALAGLLIGDRPTATEPSVTGKFFSVLHHPEPTSAVGRADYIPHGQQDHLLFDIEAQKNGISADVTKLLALPFVKALDAPGADEA